MKTLAPILCVLLMGCSTMPDVERLNKTLHEGSPSYKIEADYKRKTVSISFSNPMLGISAGAGDVFMHPPTNTLLNVTQHQYSLAPEGAKVQSQSTNQVSK